MAETPTGLCAGCSHQRIVGNTRGSSFSLCEYAKVDERYPKYPRLPVRACDAYAPRSGRGGTGASPPPVLPSSE